MRQFRPTTVKVPERAHPIVTFLFEEMKRQRVGYFDLSDRSGVRRGTISAWAHRQSPSLANVEAALNALGLELYVRKRPQ